MITKLENRFEDLKEKFSKEEMVLIIAKFEAEKLFNEIELNLELLSNVSNKNEVKRRCIVLYKQAKEFLTLLEDLIEMKKEYAL